MARYSVELLYWVLTISILITVIFCDDDCYQYSKGSYSTIISCSHGCQFSYKVKAGRNMRQKGGCATGQISSGCQQVGDLTTCTCSGDRCNERGYDMYADSSEEN